MAIYTQEEKISFFREMLLTIHNLYFTELSEHNYDIVYCNAPDERIIKDFFRIDNSLEHLEDVRVNRPLSGHHKNSGPIIHVNTIGMTILSDVEFRDGLPNKFHMIGPFFLGDYSVKTVQTGAEKLQLSVKQKHAYMDVIRGLPVIPISRVYEYGIMLRYCLTGETVHVSDFILSDTEDFIPDWAMEDKHGTYMIEQKITEMVSEGNLQYQEVFDRYQRMVRLEIYSCSDYLRQAKDSAIVFCTLCSRAAIRGGLSPEIAYIMNDRYIAEIESSIELRNVIQINQQIIADYIQMVHNLKQTEEISPQIRECCDYIDLHPEKNLNIHTLAERAGYSDHYFSAKFKKETGMSIRTYVMHKKIECAKEYLQHTDQDVQSIAETLGFSSASYFGEVFREYTGMSAMEYREKSGRAEM